MVLLCRLTVLGAALSFLLGHCEIRYGMWAVSERSTGDLIGRAGLYRLEGWPGIELGG